jgi:hypothetical protein
VRVEVRLQPSLRVLPVLLVREHPEPECVARESEAEHFLIQTALRGQRERRPPDRGVHAHQRHLPRDQVGRVPLRQLSLLHGVDRGGDESAFQQQNHPQTEVQPLPQILQNGYFGLI